MIEIFVLAKTIKVIANTTSFILRRTIRSDQSITWYIQILIIRWYGRLQRKTICSNAMTNPMANSNTLIRLRFLLTEKKLTLEKHMKKYEHTNRLFLYAVK